MGFSNNLALELARYNDISLVTASEAPNELAFDPVEQASKRKRASSFPAACDKTVSRFG